MNYKFRGVLTENGWISPCFIQVDENGKLKQISNQEEVGIQYENKDQYILPGFQNAHSHAFQYGMAGLAEIHDVSKTGDDFWSWREAMYALALKISPDDVKAIAKMLYAEMLKAGYTNVAEFHYIHHDKHGKAFNNLSEMGEQLIQAAKETGIKITLIPIFYQMGGFGKEAVDGQKRFLSKDSDQYLKLLEASQNSTMNYDKATIGIGIHSLRGVKGEDVIEVSKNFDQNLPFHIHISEQLKEVEDCISFTGKRPVEWLLENISVTERFHLVHATHLNNLEIEGIAKTKANVVLCPSTEGNLGDGIFPLGRYQKLNGYWSIGTDSHIGISPFEELRILDYGQRLITHQRNTFTSDKMGDSGFYAIHRALISGRRAMGINQVEFFKLGEDFDGVGIAANHPLLEASSTTSLTSTMVYSSDTSKVVSTFVAGKEVIVEGKHRKENEISHEFITALKSLQSR